MSVVTRRSLQFALIATLTFFSFAAAQETESDKYIEFHGPNAHPGYPDAFQLYHKLGKNLVSPNGQFGIIYPSPWLIDSPPADYVVAVRESRIIGIVETESPYFSGVNGDLAAHWSPDSSVVVVEIDGKWLPRNLVVIELSNGEIVRQTQLADSLVKMFSPALLKAEPKRGKNASVEELTVDDVKWTNSDREIEIRCHGATNPKSFPEENEWVGELVAIWDVPHRKFIRSSVKQISFRKGQPEQ